METEKRAASNALYLAYRDKVCAYVRSRVGDAGDGEDLVSTVFLKIIENYDAFDESRGSASTWIYAITRNVVRDYYRGRQRRPSPAYLEELSYELPSSDAADENCLREEDLEVLADALEKLTEREKLLILLRYDRGYSLKKTAELLHVTYSNAKYIHTSALAKLRLSLHSAT